MFEHDNSLNIASAKKRNNKNERMEIRIGWLGYVDDVARLHVEIDKLNDPLVGFYFIRSIDWVFYRANDSTI
jgi:hypothetical protein